MSVSDTGCRIAEEHLPRLFDRFYRVCGTDGGKAGGLPARFSVLSRPKPGEEVSGDAYFIRPLRSGLFFSVIDALGHGEEAHKTAVVARELLEECFTEDLAAIADTLHRGLRHTRGAAAGFGRIRLKEGVAEHLCIGNVELRIYQGGEEKHTVSYNGTLGMETERYQVTTHPYSPQTALVMFSDGISGKFKLSEFLLEKTPVEMASYIFRNFSREYDDATVFVLK